MSKQGGEQRLLEWLFRAIDPLPLGAFRVAFGLILLFRFFTLCLAFDPLFTPASIVSMEAARAFGHSVTGETVPYLRWGLFGLSDTTAWARLLFALYGLSIAAFIIGWRTRIASVLVFVLTVSIHRREPILWTGGDLVIQCFAFWLLFLPVGAALSVDESRRAKRGGAKATVRNWTIVLLQAQLALVYFSTFLLKLSSVTWMRGIAMSEVWQLSFYARPWSPWLAAVPGLAAAATWGTMLFEIAFPLGIWNARLRPWLLAVGVFFHLAIELTLRTGTFTWAMLACYVLLVPPATLQGWKERLMGRDETPSADKRNRQEIEELAGC